jgi:hypothetical protein
LIANDHGSRPAPPVSTYGLCLPTLARINNQLVQAREARREFVGIIGYSGVVVRETEVLSLAAKPTTLDSERVP